MDYAKLSKCWRETVYGNNITLCGGKDPLHRVFYLHKSNMCAMIRKRTYVLKEKRRREGAPEIDRTSRAATATHRHSAALPARCR